MFKKLFECSNMNDMEFASFNHQHRVENKRKDQHKTHAVISSTAHIYTLTNPTINTEDGHEYAALNDETCHPVAQASNPSGPEKWKKTLLYVVLLIQVILIVAVVAIGVVVGISKANQEDGSWNEWGPWEECSATCNYGMERRERSCMIPKGNVCYGDTIDYRICIKTQCLGSTAGRTTTLLTTTSTTQRVTSSTAGRTTTLLTTTSTTQRVTNTLPDNFLLFTVRVQGTIIRMDINSTSFETISKSNANPIAIDYDYINGRVYWTDVSFRQIRSVYINGTFETVVKNLDKNSIPDGMAVDSISGLIFYTDTGNDVITVMTLDGSASAVIINSTLYEPRAIVVDPIKAKLYWSDWGAVPKIEMSNYDGTNRQTVVTGSGMMWPNALAVDDKAGVIYWVDGGSGTIEKVNLDGSGRKKIYNESLTRYFGLALSEDILYYTDWNERTIMSISTTGLNKKTVGPPAFGGASDIHVHNSAFTPTGTNGCANGKAGCSHICIPVAGGSRKCLCPTGMNLQSNGMTCA